MITRTIAFIAWILWTKELQVGWNGTARGFIMPLRMVHNSFISRIEIIDFKNFPFDIFLTALDRKELKQWIKGNLWFLECMIQPALKHKLLYLLFIVFYFEKIDQRYSKRFPAFQPKPAGGWGEWTDYNRRWPLLFQWPGTQQPISSGHQTGIVVLMEYYINSVRAHWHKFFKVINEKSHTRLLQIIMWEVQLWNTIGSPSPGFCVQLYRLCTLVWEAGANHNGNDETKASLICNL